VPIRSVDDTSNVATLPGGPRGVWMMNRSALLGREHPTRSTSRESGPRPPAAVCSAIWRPAVDPNRAVVVAPRLEELVVGRARRRRNGRQNHHPARADLQRCRLRSAAEDGSTPRPPADARNLRAKLPPAARGGVRAGKPWRLRAGAGPRLPALAGLGQRVRALGAGGCGSAKPGELSPTALRRCHSTSSPTTSCTPWAGSCRGLRHHHLPERHEPDRPQPHPRPVLHGHFRRLELGLS